MRSEYISQHRGQLTTNSSDSEDNDDNDEEDPIDVVGGTDLTDEESQDCPSHHQRNDSVEHLISYNNSNSNDTSKHSIRPNPFSIENILFRST